MAKKNLPGTMLTIGVLESTIFAFWLVLNTGFILALWNLRGGEIELNALAVSITVLEIIIVLMAIFGFWVFRREVISTAEDVASTETPKCVSKYMDEEAYRLVRECLQDDQVVARLAERIHDLGIESAEDAGEIDTQAEWSDDNGK